MSGNKVTRPTHHPARADRDEGDTLPNSVELYDRLSAAARTS